MLFQGLLGVRRVASAVLIIRAEERIDWLAHEFEEGIAARLGHGFVKGHIRVQELVPVYRALPGEDGLALGDAVRQFLQRLGRAIQCSCGSYLHFQYQTQLKELLERPVTRKHHEGELLRDLRTVELCDYHSAAGGHGDKATLNEQFRCFTDHAPADCITFHEVHLGRQTPIGYEAIADDLALKIICDALRQSAAAVISAPTHVTNV